MHGVADKIYNKQWRHVLHNDAISRALLGGLVRLYPEILKKKKNRMNWVEKLQMMMMMMMMMMYFDRVNQM